MTYTNPVMNDNRPDPGILKLDSGGFVVVTTSDHAKAGIDPALPIIFSKDLINWKQVRISNCYK
jgi:beta-xylosidase